jgi:predicted XRE-type DNA-binding protein
MDTLTFYEQFLYWFLLGSFSLMGILLFSIIALKIYGFFSIKNNFTKKMQEVKDMKAKGEHHEWVEININGTVVHVCKKTGFVPKHDGFIDVNKLKAYLADKEEREEELRISNEYMRGVAEEIATRNGITADQVSEIVKEYQEKQSHYFAQKIKDKLDQFLSKKH